MALIKCPECGKEISNTCRRCPSCGYALMRNKKRILSIVVVSIVILLAIVLIVSAKPHFEENNAAATARNAAFSIGNYIKFGSYPQTASGSDDTPIEWQVLARDGDKALLVSRYALDCQQYNKDYKDVTWEHCTLRKWLNDDFLNRAFSIDKQRGIITTTVTSDKNPKYSTNPGNDTKDKIFLLSIKEVEELYVTDEAMICSSTDYAYQQGLYTYDNGECWWWLRSPGIKQIHAALVHRKGGVYHDGDSVAFCLDGGYGVRPALWVDLDSGVF